jgi:hypothetical protein
MPKCFISSGNPTKEELIQDSFLFFRDDRHPDLEAKHIAMVPSMLYRYRACNSRNLALIPNHLAWFSAATEFSDTNDSLIHWEVSKALQYLESHTQDVFILLLSAMVPQGLRKAGASLSDSDCIQIAEGLRRLMKNNALSLQGVRAILLSYVSADLASKVIPNLLRIYSSPMERRDYLLDTKKTILMVQELNLAQKEGLYVCCFSEKGDDPWMWEHYAQGGSGYCIVYSFSKKCPRSLLLALTPMIYEKKESLKILDLLTNPILNGVDEFLYSPFSLKIKMTAFAKDPNCAPEQEWRLGFYRPGSGSGFPFYLPLEKKVILGPNFRKDGVAEQRLLTLLESSKIPFVRSKIRG